MLAKLTKKMQTQEQKSASSSSCSDEALGQKEVRWSHLVGNGTGQNILPTLQIFFICFSHMLWRNMSELWWRSRSWKGSKRSWGRRSTLRVRRSTGESSSHSLLLQSLNSSRRAFAEPWQLFWGAFQAGIQTQRRRRGTFQSESQISAPAGESYFSVWHEPAVVVEVVLKEINSGGKEIEQWFGIIFRCGLIPIKFLKTYS